MMTDAEPISRHQKLARVAAVSLLLIEDNLGDVRLVKETLSEGYPNIRFSIGNVGTLEAGLQRLRNERFDAILLDLGLPDSTGIETFNEVRAIAERVPIIILTQLNDEELAVDALRSGAQDYIMKDQIMNGTLVRAIRYAMERKSIEDRLADRTREAERAGTRAQTYFDFLAHDVANVLSPVMAYAEMINASKDSTAQTKARAEKIVDQLKRATALILNLRRLEEIERIPREQLDNIDLRQSLLTLEERLRLDFPDKNMGVSYDLPPDELLLARGGESVESVILGVLENAMIHAGSDRVEIEARVTSVRGPSGDLFWKVEISDHGRGIPDDLKQLLLAPQDSQRSISRGVASSLVVFSAILNHVGGCLRIEDRVPGRHSDGVKMVLVLPRGGGDDGH